MAPVETPPPSKWQIWYRAARPRTLTATYVPLALAGVIALDQSVFDLPKFILSLIAAVLLQVSANLINEYYDFRRGAEDQKQAGQGMILKNALLSPREILTSAVITVVAGAAIGLFLLFHSGIWLLLIGLGGVLVVITYTAGPYPLAYHGLGEAAVFVFMGPLMILGAYYVMAVRLDWTPVLVGFPVGLMVAAILHANNVRDIESDAAVNKRTLAVVLGPRAARIEYAVLVSGAYAAVALLILVGVMPATAAVVLVTFPEALRLIRLVTENTDPQLLHQAQGRTARLHGAFGLWLALGWLAWLLIDSLIAG
ncbi:MAG: 1,4-dihydroxy-2-naphthoate octaprenyltransferase [Anaerolineae bacterium]|nr:1,4-dihydroxy-2-naphthoate octaprenyltransferase [Anaerolineae bacterium]